jgi:Ca2+-binding EF-hand superfamily protein
MNKVILALPVAALLFTAHLAFAADEAPKNPKQAQFEAEFKAADTNGDGGLSQEELAKTPEGQFKSIKNNFEKMDTNKDGKVTIDEMEKWIKNAKYRMGK